VDYRWRSDIDGTIGREAAFSTSDLSGGIHTISFQVQDDQGLWSEAVYGQLTVRSAPLATIESISRSPVGRGEEVSFSGNGRDAVEVVSYRWESNIDGVICSVASFQTNNLSPGNHRISLTVRDNDGMWSPPATGLLTVTAGPATIVIDNRSSEASQTGTWTVSTAPDPYPFGAPGADSVYARAGATFTYRFSPPSEGFYDVAFWWTQWSSRSTEVPLRINHADGTFETTVDQTANGGRWNDVGSFYFRSGETYNATITADSATASACADAVRFKRSGILRLKWAIDLSSVGQIMPVMGDIDNDGEQELVMAAGDKIFSVDGTTGEIEWAVDSYYRWSWPTAIELVDLNRDGRPEILYATSLPPRLVALNGNGSFRWASRALGGEELSLFPIIAHDINGDGYPTLYLASEDSSPDPYSGNDADYNGQITMLNHNGVVLNSTWIHHPCWGGMALADANFDGQFELFVGDRRFGYHNFPAQGVQAFNAHTLEPLWARPDIHHSSPMPVLVDVIGDRNLEVVAAKITSSGPLVLNAMTGETIFDYTDKGFPDHGTPTVHDVDEDGNVEFITAASYPTSAPKNFVVFDLINGETDFEAYFDFWTAWPPKIGDITGDGHMEILVATGNQADEVGISHGESYPLLIYNRNFELIDRIDMPLGTGQLTPARVYDTDNDGYNEVVVASFNGKLMVYDTNATTQSPSPNTWVQMYSVYRRGVAEYVDVP
jgi:hypothetical protein